MLTLNDPIEIDILSVLLNAPQMRMRRNEIKNQLVPKYQGKYAEGSFDVVLQRRLDKLSWILEKDYVARSSFYSIRKKMKERVENLIKKQEINSLIPSLDTRWLEPLRRFLIRVKHEGQDPKVFLNSHCITFIGDIPGAFPTSVEAMQSHLAFKRSLYKRHQRDLDGWTEKYMETRRKYGKGSKEFLDLHERIREEVGWTVGEYLKKLLNKAEKEKGIRKLMTVFGITEEMLAEMYSRGT